MYLNLTAKALGALSVLISLSALVAGCQKSAPAALERPPLKVTVVTAAAGDEYRWIETLGQTEGVEQAEVRAQVSGILEKITYREGDSVQAGDTLFVLDQAPYRAALASAVAARRQVEAQLMQDEREEARYRKLFEAKASSRKEWDDARSAVAIRRALLASARAQENAARINLERTEVKSPSDGVVSMAEVNKGALVTATSTLLAHITQPEKLRVRFTVSERDLKGAPITLQNKVRLRVASGETYDGSLDYVATQVDVQSATRTMRARIPGKKAGFLPGQLVHVELQAELLKGVYRVPQRAVLQKPDGSYQVYVASGGRAHAVTVTVGLWKDSDWIVLSGLSGGEAIIVDNIQKLRDGMKIEAQPLSDKAKEAKVLPGNLESEPPATF